MSGDTQSLPVVASILLLAMANTRMRAEPVNFDSKDLARMHAAFDDAENKLWIGGAYANDTSPYDDLVAFAKVDIEKLRETKKSKKAATSATLKKPAASSMKKRPAGASAKRGA